MTLAAGGSLLPVGSGGDFIECIGDSITASVRLLYTGGASEYSVMDGSNSWPAQLARRLALKPRVVGFGGTGITTGGSGGVPATPQSFPYAYGSSPYSPAIAPAVVVLYLGTNEAGASQASYRPAYRAFLAQVRAAYPAAVIFAAVPLTCPGLSPSILGAVADLADHRIIGLDYSTAGSPAYALGPDTADSIGHVNPGGAAKLAARLASDVRAQLDALGIRVQAAGSGDGTLAAINASLASIKAKTDRLAFDDAGRLEGLMLDPAGLDPVIVEAAGTNPQGVEVPAINARQALSLKLAQLSGPITGLGAGTGTGAFTVRSPAGVLRGSGTMAGDERIVANVYLPA